MPELPEVETVRRGLAQHILGKKIQGIRIHDARSVKKNFTGPKGFEDELVDSEILAVVRRGKFIWMPISTKRALVCHLGMSGQVLIRSADFEADPLTRITFQIATGARNLEMRFVDQRLFGGIYIDGLQETIDGKPAGFFPEGKSSTLIPSSASHIARDLLDPAFDRDYVVTRIKAKNSGIKRVLLDQNLLSGIGNIYADETLWRARVFYDKPASALSKAKLRELIDVATEVLSEAVQRGGTSFDQQYKNVNGESGYFSQDLNAYSRSGLPCPRCETPIRRQAWANRSSYFCPRCQRR